MEQIVIEVEDRLAVKWRTAAPDVKLKAMQEVEHYLNQILESRGDDFWQFLEQARVEAEARGFNDDVLNDVLSEK